MMRTDALNWHDCGGYTEMNSPSSTVFYTDEDESKQIIVSKNLSQNYSAEVNKLCSAEIDKSEYTHVPNFNVSNVFECGRNNPDVSYERAYMATEYN